MVQHVFTIGQDQLTAKVGLAWRSHKFSTPLPFWPTSLLAIAGALSQDHIPMPLLFGNR